MRVIDQRLDAANFVVAHRLAVGEVEAEFFRIDQRALLLHVIAEDFAQGPVGEVGGGVVFLGAAARRRQAWR